MQEPHAVRLDPPRPSLSIRATDKLRATRKDRGLTTKANEHHHVTKEQPTTWQTFDGTVSTDTTTTTPARGALQQAEARRKPDWPGIERRSPLTEASEQTPRSSAPPPDEMARQRQYVAVYRTRQQSSRRALAHHTKVLRHITLSQVWPREYSRAAICVRIVDVHVLQFT